MMYMLYMIPGSMAITWARSSNDHIIDGVVIFLSDVDRVCVLQLLITKSVQLGEGDTQVGGFQQVLNFLAIWIESRWVELDIWRQYSVNDLRT